MNLLFSVPHLGLGGVTTYVLHLAAAMSQKHRVIIFDHYPYMSDTDFCKWLPKEVTVEKVRDGSLKDKITWKLNGLLKRAGLRFNLWIYLKDRHFMKVLSKYRINLIVSFDEMSDTKVVQLAGNKVPIVLSIHGSYDISEFFSLSEEKIAEYEPVFRTVSAIVYKSDCNIRILEHYPKLDNLCAVKKILHGFTYNQVTRDASMLKGQLGIPGHAFVFGMLCRGVPEKGWEEAIEAFLKLKQASPAEIHFVAVGQSSYLSALKEKYSAEPAVHFTGFVENNIEWVNTFDAGLLPTYAKTENYAFSVVEYLFCGKPVITTRHGEIPTTIDCNGEKAGFLTELKDGKADVDALFLAMKTYLDDRETYEKHSLLARKAFEKFDSRKAVEAYEEVFYSVLNKNPEKD